VNDILTNTIFKFLDLYVGDGYWCKRGKVITHQNYNYTITPPSYLITNNGTVIFECLGSGLIIVSPDLIDIISNFFKLDSYSTRQIIIEWFLTKHNLTKDDVGDIFKKAYNIT